MRLSTQLIVNATTTYARLGATFVIGIFYVWFIIGEIGIAAYGMIALSTGTFGLSFALERTISSSLSREMAVAISSDNPENVTRTLTSSMAFCALAGLATLLISMGVAALAYVGIFNVVEGHPGIEKALAFLFFMEGAHSAIRVFMAPFQQALYASKRVGLDNMLRIVQRMSVVGAAVIAIGVVWPTANLNEKLIGFGLFRACGMLVDILLATFLARRLIPGLKIRFNAFDIQEFRNVASTCWHTGQMTMLMDFSTQFMALLINMFFGVAYNGIWQVVVQIGGHAMLISEGVMRGIDPIATHLLQAGRKSMILDLMTRSIRYQLAIALPWTITFIIFMTPILNLWIGGRLEKDTGLIEAGLSVEKAIRVTALMASVYLLAVLSRVTTRGVERILYGIGEVRAYAWFAKYTIMLSIGGGAALFWLTDNPLLAPLPIVFVNALYYGVIIPFAARKRTKLPLRRTVAESIPRPILASCLFAVILLILKPYFMDLNLISLVILFGIAGFTYIPLCYIIVIRPDERLRILEMIGGILRRKSSEREEPAWQSRDRHSDNDNTE
ncbi:MAG: hypothetical protein O7G85_06835 [Planctomycetota bacterium]|nr:hypothetical protein [Planctomycetota bacterium]